MANIAIITGGSKGIGLALADKYLENNYQVFSIARSKIAKKNNLHNYSCDLSDPIAGVNTLQEILKQIDFNSLTSIVLINNAGSLGDISNIENNTAISIEKTIALNLSTPLALTSSFIKELKETKCKKYILNISSGAAIKPYEGWSVYCSSKAGLDMATRTISNEQKSSINPVKINAIYPGVVATGMQSEIRKTSELDFKNVQRFIDLKNNNELFQPKYVADKIFQLDINNLLENGAIVDIRNL